MAPLRPFRLVYRSFKAIGFDPAKSAEVFEFRGFDLAYIARIFPGWVLEREDNRGYSQPRYQAIGELFGRVYVVVYSRSDERCRLITAWEAEPEERARWYDFTR
jgi:uncharacterized DUF497 family protein